jgi:hypothetical protein
MWGHRKIEHFVSHIFVLFEYFLNLACGMMAWERVGHSARISATNIEGSERRVLKIGDARKGPIFQMSLAPRSALMSCALSMISVWLPLLSSFSSGY